LSAFEGENMRGTCTHVLVVALLAGANAVATATTTDLVDGRLVGRRRRCGRIGVWLVYSPSGA
jgi:hypothetical protein